ncbi:alkaline phosphatase family protein [Aestuariibacter halophilus]|uniref:Alkaline phosphatase family protein n=1 Tax=Fluctibacter halophilus TaxID=226011 RepID=A0ABS8GD31_9ALTE|nr:alkaline phosphatase D family protein [Aestuariibacter halophilus]MCC2617775.1 alkaline phosphatase family protein [Aestuariibacter halophilus]
MTSRLLSACLLAFATQANATTLLFGSCAHQDEPLPILRHIAEQPADAFVFLGDNIYGDTEDMAVLAAKYQKLGNNPNFQALQHAMPVHAIWDDHDYGENDAGAEYPQKEASRQIMLNFWGAPKDSPRRSRPDGIYTDFFIGEGEQRIHVILPDLRWNRAPLNGMGKIEYVLKRRPDNRGPYSPSEDPTASMLGEAQWQWLENAIKQPAALTIIGSSLQVLPDFTGWEAWVNFPADRQRLFNVIRENNINGVMLISGDTHWGEISRYDTELDYPLWEVTSSGLTEEWKQISPNKHRIGDATHTNNYGFVTINTEVEQPFVHVGLKDAAGNILMAQKVLLSSLRPY